MMSFGVAMEKTGADQYLANLIVVYFEQYGAIAVLAGFFALTVALTQPMSNQAAALGHSSRSGKNRRRARSEPAHFRRRRHLRRLVFLYHAARTGVRAGLHARTLPLYGFRQNRHDSNQLLSLS
jgi:hypothetical protein